MFRGLVIEMFLFGLMKSKSHYFQSRAARAVLSYQDGSMRLYLDQRPERGIEAMGRKINAVALTWSEEKVILRPTTRIAERKKTLSA